MPSLGRAAVWSVLVLGLAAATATPTGSAVGSCGTWGLGARCENVVGSPAGCTAAIAAAYCTAAGSPVFLGGGYCQGASFCLEGQVSGACVRYYALTYVDTHCYF